MEVCDIKWKFGSAASRLIPHVRTNMLAKCAGITETTNHACWISLYAPAGPSPRATLVSITRLERLIQIARANVRNWPWIQADDRHS